MLKPAFVDLSHYNVIPGKTLDEAAANLSKAKDAGVIGMIHKCTEGLTYQDDKCKARRELCGEASLCWGLYHFLRAGSIAEQAAFFYDTGAAMADEETLWVCDFEVDGISLAEVQSFLEQIEAVTHRLPVLYSGHSLKDALNAGQNGDGLKRFPLWICHYTSNPQPTLPAGWDTYWAWQYTDQGSIAGIQAPTDLNAYDGTVDELLKGWTLQPEPEPKPEPGPDRQIVNIDIDTPEGVAVHITVNGRELF